MNLRRRLAQYSLFRKRIPLQADPRLARDMQLVILAVTVGTISFTINGGAAFTGFNQAMGFNDFFFGLIMGMPVFGAMMQLVVSYLLETTRRRRRIFVTAGLIGRLLWIPIALVPYFLPEELQQGRLWSVVILLTLYQGFNAAVNVGFYSWMGDLIPMKIRGRYFSTRSAISTVAGLLTGWFVGWYLDAFPGLSSYTVLLIVAGIAGALDIVFFIFITDPPMEAHKPPAFLPFLREAVHNKPFMRLLVYVVVFSFGVQISAPFYNVYALNTIHMSFTQLFLFSQLTNNVFNILFIRRWGGMQDSFGNKPILRIAGCLCASLPLLWIFSRPGEYWMVAIINILAGIGWGAVDLSTQNLLLRNSPQRNRSMYIALYSLGATALGTAVANIAGGGFLTFIAPLALRWNLSLFGWSLTKYHYLFILSSAIRFLAILVLAPRIQEEDALSVRQVFGTWMAKWKRIRF